MELKKLSYSEVQAFINAADVASFPVLNFTILRNIVVEPIEPYLRYLALKMGFSLSIKFGQYDNIIPEILSDNSLLTSSTNCVFVFVHLENLSWDLARNFPALAPNKIELEIKRVEEYAKNVILGIRQKTRAMILWHGFTRSYFPNLGIIDSQMEGQNFSINKLNEGIKKILSFTKNAYFVDVDLCVSRVGSRYFFDHRYWHIARSPYSREALNEIATEDFRHIKAYKGKNKKCLILDCDNVLWGGVVGEDGLSGIQLGRTYPGSAFLEFQQEILNLYHRGVILALCSKNNENDVWEVFENHPDMLLKRKHITIAKINWEDKANNISQIAQDLNIGVDSIVFADDSEFEINLVKQALPDVEVIHMPKEKAMEYQHIIASSGLFDTLAISDEDKHRSEMYQSELERKKLRSQVVRLEDYYHSLEMVLEIKLADKVSIPRIAQLTQKTNQFNLTTRRYTDADIEEFVKSNSSDVLSVRLEDRFGDYGIIGVCILKHVQSTTTIDTFLLSCRALGRGVEDAFLVKILELAKIRKSKALFGEFIATSKNAQVKDFYQKNGFSRIRSEKNAEHFLIHLNACSKNMSSFFKRVTVQFSEDSDKLETVSA